MQLDVVLVPELLRPTHLEGRAVVVFDVLRATTSMAAALDAGVAEIRVYADLAAAAAAAGPPAPQRLLAGEAQCLPPDGFDLGNSPGAFTRARHAGRVMHLSTTNGTRAIAAARGAARVFTGALVNAAATARAVASTGLDVTLLCAGTGGLFALEDALGAGAVLDHLLRADDCRFDSDAPLMAHRLFAAARGDLRPALAETRGGQNVTNAGLAPDIDFAARLDVIDLAGAVVDASAGAVPIVRAWRAN